MTINYLKNKIIASGSVDELEYAEAVEVFDRAYIALRVAREALDFYGNVDSYGKYNLVMGDKGEKARTALARIDALNPKHERGVKE